jgi:hypothetical protein
MSFEMNELTKLDHKGWTQNRILVLRESYLLHLGLGNLPSLASLHTYFSTWMIWKFLIYFIKNTCQNIFGCAMCHRWPYELED